MPARFPPTCKTNLFLGVFFDGTNNNLKRDREKNGHSNVARLYEAFPGGSDEHDSEPWKDLANYPNFFRTYIPGVGTPFDKVNDSGKGFSPYFSDRGAGLAFARHAESRIVWALVQTVNNVHRFYTGHDLIHAPRFQQDFLPLTLTGPRRKGKRWLGLVDGDWQRFDRVFGDVLKTLHTNLEAVLPPGDERPPKSMDKGWVEQIYFSCFGFSRGATEARAFANWFVRLCELDASLKGRTGMSLGGIPVTFDFLGLFDTVASVGLANSFLGIPDGHQAWADAEESLRIPGKEHLSRCLHLVSAHEVRRSFPLDSAHCQDASAKHIEEVVYPGVHSDVGGGYLPREQGRGTDPSGRDKLSRIPLADMYRAARLAGVPLKLELAPETVRESFTIAPETIAAGTGDHSPPPRPTRRWRPRLPSMRLNVPGWSVQPNPTRRWHNSPSARHKSSPATRRQSLTRLSSRRCGQPGAMASPPQANAAPDASPPLIPDLTTSL